jgi:hypothetical protein
MKGTIVNFIAIIIGAGAGMLLKSGIPEKMKETLMNALSLAVLVIGIQMALTTKNTLIVVLSLALGAAIGEMLNIDGWLNKLGEKMNAHLGDKYGDVGKGFVYASLIFCIGAMAIVGSIQEGISQNAEILYAKSLIDGVAAVVFAAAMGAGVALSAVPVALYQGSITLSAAFISSFLTEGAIGELTAVGGVLIMAIGVNMLGVKEIRIANLLPALPIGALLALAGVF